MAKCWRCDGKGGYEQWTQFSEDDTAWDLCPECNGSGKSELPDSWKKEIEQEKRMEEMEKELEDDRWYS